MSQPVSIDRNEITEKTIRELGAENAILTLELNAQRAAVSALLTRVAELENQIPKDADADQGKEPTSAEKAR